MSVLWRVRLLRILGGFAIVLLTVVHDLGNRKFPMLAAIDRQLYDGRQSPNPRALDPRIVIVDIDERSLAEHGRWPWRRTRVADLVDTIFKQGKPAVLGLDMLFAEGDDEPATAPALAITAGSSPALRTALQGRPVVLGYYLTSDRGGRRSGQMPQPAFDQAVSLADFGQPMVHADGYAANIAELAQVAEQGFFNAFVGAGIDVDGTIRALPLLAALDGAVYESFVVAVLRQYLGDTRLVAGPGLLSVQGARQSVDFQPSVGYTAMVPFAGRGGRTGGRFLYLSASDVLTGRVDWTTMEGRIVLLGTSSPGLTDLRPTPVSEVFPGVEIHASLIAGALDDDIRLRPVEAGAIGALASTVVGGTLSVALPFMGPVGTAVAGVVALLLLVGGEALAYWMGGWVLPLAAAVSAVLMLTLFNLLFGYLAEGRARRAVVRLFGEYLSQPLVEEMARDPVRWKVTASVDRELSVLFADIRGFTAMAESMSPDVLREYLNTVLTVLTEVIHRHGGTVDKYIGDAVMAFWGAPLDDDEHADHAVDAALEIQEAARKLSDSFVQRGWPALSVGVGINTGVVRVGDMGSALRRTYTAIGDAVNLAARIEALTKRFVLPIIVGESTATACKRHQFDQLARLLVEGRTVPVCVYVPRHIARMGQWGGAYNVTPLRERRRNSRLRAGSRQTTAVSQQAGSGEDVSAPQQPAERPHPVQGDGQPQQAGGLPETQVVGVLVDEPKGPGM